MMYTRVTVLLMCASPDTAKVEVRIVSVVQVGDTVGIECIITLGENYTEPSVPAVWWSLNSQLLKPAPVKHDSAIEGVLTKTRTLENVSVSDAGTYTCQYDEVGSYPRGSSTAHLQVVDEGVCGVTHCCVSLPQLNLFFSPSELVSVISNLSSLGTLRVTGPSDNATNVYVVFHVHADIAPVIAAYPLQQDSAAGYLLQAITMEPQWTEREKGTRMVWVELQPSRLANVSIQLQEERTAVLVLNMSYYTHSAVASLNVTFLPYPPVSQPTGADQAGLLGGLTTVMLVLLLGVTAVSVLAVLSCLYWRQVRHRHLHSKHIHLELVERPEDRLRRKILKEVRRICLNSLHGSVRW